MREIGVTCSGQRGADDSKTLAQAKFQIGDFLDINISPANRKPEPRQDRRDMGRDMGRDRRPYWAWQSNCMNLKPNLFIWFQAVCRWRFQSEAKIWIKMIKTYFEWDFSYLQAEAKL